MEWLNYHHLLYFWTVARTGSVARAAVELRLAQPTISGQIRRLEESLEEKLFQRAGRGLALTEMGRVVYRYADEIFALGRELSEVVRGRPTGRPQRLVVGIADVVPKLVTLHLLTPVLALRDPVQITCREGKSERLLAELAAQDLDVVLTDAPLPPGARIKAYSHLLAESAVQFFGAAALAVRYRRNFPASLEGAPVYLPTESTAMRRSLDQWFMEVGVRPVIRGEFDDSALMKVFGQGGGALFPGPALLAADIRKRYGVQDVGMAPLEAVRERFYVISAERRIRHPAVLLISETARILQSTELPQSRPPAKARPASKARSIGPGPPTSGGRKSSRPGASSRKYGRRGRP